jgi:hypothetical protein
MTDDDGPILDESLPLAAFFIEVMEHADQLEANDPSGHGHNHEAFRLRGMADVCYHAFCLIANELRYEVGTAMDDDEDAEIPMFILGVMDAVDTIDAWSKQSRSSARAAKRSHHHKGHK